MTRPLTMLIAITVLAACGGDGKRVDAHGESAAGSSASVAPPDPDLGAWRFTRFDGGPPHPGDIFEKVEVDFSTGTVRVVHILTDDGSETACRIDMSGAASLEAVAARADSPAIRSAFSHPDELRVPPDAANFTASRDASSSAGGPGAPPLVIAVETYEHPGEGPEKTSLRALGGDVAKLVTDALRDPACASVRR